MKRIRVTVCEYSLDARIILANQRIPIRNNFEFLHLLKTRCWKTPLEDFLVPIAGHDHQSIEVSDEELKLCTKEFCRYTFANPKTETQKRFWESLTDGTCSGEYDSRYIIVTEISEPRDNQYVLASFFSPEMGKISEDFPGTEYQARIDPESWVKAYTPHGVSHEAFLRDYFMEIMPQIPLEGYFAYMMETHGVLSMGCLLFATKGKEALIEEAMAIYANDYSCDEDDMAIIRNDLYAEGAESAIILLQQDA